MVGAKRGKPATAQGGEIYLKELWRARCTKQEYLDVLKLMNERYGSLRVVMKTVAAQEYLAQGGKRWISVKRLKRTTDKVARACRLQSHFESGQILMPARSGGPLGD